VSDPKRANLARWLRGDGIEIGALDYPLWVPDGARVRYVDRMTVEQQREHYPELAGKQLAAVDVIDDGGDLATFADESLDFVIANHILEHLEDPIAALLNFERVLRPSGIVYLAMPDHRTTFDSGRELTTVDHLLREHDEGPEASRPEHYLDWARNVLHAGDAAEAHAAQLMAEEYSIHFHTWDADTFLDFFVAARQKVGLDFDVLAFAPLERPDDPEFIVLLSKGRGTIRVPPAIPDTRPSVRDRLARTPLGPPVRAVKHAARRLRRS